MYPSLWSFGENHVGYPSWGNTLGASIGVRAEKRSSKPMRLREIRQSFVDVELRKREQDGDITAVTVLDERPLQLQGATAAELLISLESKAGPQLTRNILIERGFYSYKIVLSSPKAWTKAYAPIFDEMIAGIRLSEPEAVQRARTIVSTFPGMSSAHVELAHQLASIGLVKLAAQAYQRALQALPEQADALYGLAKLAADYEGDVEDAEKIALSLHEHRPEEPTYSALLADLQLRLGQVDGACAVLQETLDLISDPPEDLRERLRTLKCRTDGATLH
jgi:tetratricopeptide (TPR) repeat protein